MQKHSIHVDDSAFPALVITYGAELNRNALAPFTDTLAAAYWRAESADVHIITVVDMTATKTASLRGIRGNPVQVARGELRRQRIPTADQFNASPEDGRRVHLAGMVICRQRPQTASGGVFMTLEDETGMVNAVVSRDVFARHAVVAKTASLLGITGLLQLASGVVHLVAKSLWVPKWQAPSLIQSRDFN